LLFDVMCFCLYCDANGRGISLDFTSEVTTPNGTVQIFYYYYYYSINRSINHAAGDTPCVSLKTNRRRGHRLRLGRE